MSAQSPEDYRNQEASRLLEPQKESQPSSLDGQEVAYEAGEKILVFNLVSFDADSVTEPSFSWKRLWLFTGPGLLMSTAFLDPGNLEGGLQAGAIAGYSLLWLLTWATIMGLLMQLLSARIEVAAGRDLAELCKEEYPNWARIHRISLR